MSANGAQAEAPPHTAFPIEREVLGAALVDDQACAELMQHGRPELFAERQHEHAAIYETIERLFSQGDPVDLTTVTQAGHDPTYLSDLSAAVGVTTNVEYQCRILQEKWMIREGMQVLQGAARYLSDDGDPFDTFAGVQERLTRLTLGSESNTHIEHAVEDAIQRAEEWREGIVTDLVPTGFPGLDRLIGGLPVGELTTMAAQTGAGKTSLIVQMIRTLARAWYEQDTAVLMMSAEMTGEQVAHRAASSAASINLRDLRGGSATESQYDTYTRTLGELAALNLHVDDTAAPTLSRIRAQCQRLAAQGELGFVAVDYDEKISHESRSEEQRVAAIAKGLKSIAKQFGVPVVALSQYSRAASDNTGSPKDSWLRYSGKKEQESALILHWYWPAYWVRKGKPPEAIEQFSRERPNRGYIYATKNRLGGGTGSIPLYFEPKYTRFRDPADPENDLHKPGREHADTNTNSPF
jgi:replicative DNA helicase